MLISVAEWVQSIVIYADVQAGRGVRELQLPESRKAIISVGSCSRSISTFVKAVFHIVNIDFVLNIYPLLRQKIFNN